MTSTACPSCQLLFDSTRAGVARVRGARVVTFCSTACADVAPHAELPPTELGFEEHSDPEITIIPPNAAERDDTGIGTDEPESGEPPVEASETQAPVSDERSPSEPDDDRASPARESRAEVESDEVLAGTAETGDDGPLADDSGDDQLDVPSVETREYKPARSTRRSKIIALSAAMLVGGMVITIISTVSPSAPSNVSAERSREVAVTPKPVMASAVTALGPHSDDPTVAPQATHDTDSAQQAAVEVEADQTQPLQLDAMHAEARQILERYLASKSQRIQRIAAAALARTGHKKAISRLRRLMRNERVELRKIEIAYALARAGEPEAKKLLRRRMSHKRRDVRLDAARSLVLLGDDSGAIVLERMLSVRSHRLGAAGLLARLGMPRGIKALEKALASHKVSRENKMRSLVALGMAGDDSVRERLRELLADRRYSVGAAGALAVLSDDAAIEALQKQLALPSLRVQAALGLRRMDAPADLEVLAAALENGSDPARISAAEAVLILAGPQSIAEFD